MERRVCSCHLLDGSITWVCACSVAQVTRGVYSGVGTDYASEPYCVHRHGCCYASQQSILHELIKPGKVCKINKPSSKVWADGATLPWVFWVCSKCLQRPSLSLSHE